MEQWNINAGQVTEWRRHLHQHPELSFQEKETSEYIAGVLSGMTGIEVCRPAGTGVVGILRGAQPGGTVALRADIDALPIEEQSGVPFCSQNKNVMHACGHDAHAAMLLGAAQALSERRLQLQGTVKFLFQPAEEVSPGGASGLIAQGWLDDVAFIFGLHVAVPLPVGTGMLRAGVGSAAQDTFSIKIQGRGAHGSTPEQAADALLMGAETVNHLYHIVARNVPAREQVVLSVGKFCAGDAPNVIPDTALVEGTLRTVSPQWRKIVKTRIEEVSLAVAQAYGGSCVFAWEGYPSMCHDAQATELLRASAQSVLGQEHVLDAPIMPSSEDFSFYEQHTKGAYILLGAGTPQDGCGYPAHNPRFVLNEKALPLGSAILAQAGLVGLETCARG